ncbi:Rossmann-like alpha/beta/alpha sandwich fold protein, partial [Metarhizium brunneum ARSEF 3297]
MPDALMSTKQTAARFANALRSFSASGDAFRVLSTVPPRTETPPPPPDSLIGGAGAGGRGGDDEAVFLCGFDTVVRIFEPRYYGGSGGMGSALGPFFRRARLRVTMRPDGAWGTAGEQAAYVAGLEGTLGRSGGDAAWVRRIELVDGVEGAVSSSRVRELVRTGERGPAVEGLVGAEVARWIDEEGLYRE